MPRRSTARNWRLLARIVDAGPDGLVPDCVSTWAIDWLLARRLAVWRHGRIVATQLGHDRLDRQKLPIAR